HEDIVAGLVYSICMNYSNRVKGNKPVGEKVFMQGGVCYNKAVPFAMASLVGKPIIVPPEPGLMGAFGVALEIKKRIEKGLMAEKNFNLSNLADREVKYGKTFICRGGKEKCDRHCEVAMIELEGKKYPFGGACNRYYNLRQKIKYDVEKLDLVRVRQKLIFEKYGAKLPEGSGKKCRGRIGINRSFLVNTFYPLYSTFFTELGFEPVVPDSTSKEGIDQKNAAFCFPGELSHGFFYSLITMENPPDFIFLPHFKAVHVPNGYSSSQVCPFVQGEPYYLQVTFREKLEELKRKGTKILSPIINLTKSLENAGAPLIETAKKMGISRKEADKAFKKALQKQIECMDEMKAIGKKVLEELESVPEKTGVVIFARSYNGFVKEAHMGIPNKLASRGALVIPFDFLPFDNEKVKRHMYWGMGQLLLKAGKVVKKHPQLFGVYITNFSCGPDSFIIGYFRNYMGRKPSLTLELDSHTADAGLETRIEAFLDIVSAFRQLISNKLIVMKESSFVPARLVIENSVAKVITSSGKKIPISDPRVTLLIPSMGKIASESLAAIFRGRGINTIAHPPSDESVLKLGRANTSCKECLPLILTTGTLLNYIRNKKQNNEVIVYFMPTGSGPCRFGQYHIFMEDLVKKLEIPDVAMLSLSSENAYAGMGSDFQLHAWSAIIVSDVMEDIRSMILANAADTEEAVKIFNEEWQLILAKLETGDFSKLEKQLSITAKRFSHIQLKRPVEEVPTISLSGEIFVRRDAISRQYLTERLAEGGFAAICTPVAEWILYSDYILENNYSDHKMSKLEKLEFMIKKRFMSKYEKRIKSILSRSGLVHAEPHDMKSIINNASPYISPYLGGEAILTVGGALTEIASHVCGAIAIGPFGCMPNRLSESILNVTMNREGKLATDSKNKRLQHILTDIEDLPFLAIESDGSPFPQLINAKLETFCIRSERLHNRMLEANQKNRK
ncbi:MAG: activase, partial [Proteobacteria bacterium]|nr:activase [Pseudomonadota bacterium]